MKKFLFQIILMSICTVAIAETINLHWLNDNGTTYTESTCTVNDDLIIPTTPPTKYGYTFTGWEILPFVQIEYLESTGTQYIDTGVIADENTQIQLNFKLTDTISKQAIFGSRIALNDMTYEAIFIMNIFPERFLWLYGDLITYNRLPPLSANRWYFLKTNQGMLYLDNELLAEYKSSIFGNKGISMYLFSINDNNTTPDFSAMQCNRLRIIQNNILVRDFIPVLDKNGVPCMYDKVEDKFYYNAGTGQFIAGPVIGE